MHALIHISIHIVGCHALLQHRGCRQSIHFIAGACFYVTIQPDDASRMLAILICDIKFNNGQGIGKHAIADHFKLNCAIGFLP